MALRRHGRAGCGLTILLGAPLLLGLAALLAFFPARRGRARAERRGAGGVLLVLYGTAVTEHDPGEPLLRGLALLVLVAAWLWLPRLGPREALAGGRAGAVAGRLSLPVAAALDSERPWWNYRAWTFLENGNVDHVRLDAPLRPARLAARGDHAAQREGRSRRTTGRPRRSTPSTACAGCAAVTRRRATAAPERAGPGSPAEAAGTTSSGTPRWDERSASRCARSRPTCWWRPGRLRTSSRAPGWSSTASDGTTRIADRPLEEGDSYTVRAYAPNPTPEQMRGAPTGLPRTR